jgi:hypothetical protein
MKSASAGLSATGARRPASADTGSIDAVATAQKIPQASQLLFVMQIPSFY